VFRQIWVRIRFTIEDFGAECNAALASLKLAYGQLLPCIGFSDSPLVLSILSFIPILGGIISFVASISALWRW
jgi:hypothetical protein